MPAKKSYSPKPPRASERAGVAESERQGQALFEVANLRPERTGLPFVVFISQRGGARHDVRVKVGRSAKIRPSEMATIAIRPQVSVVRGAVDPDDLARLAAWIELNRDVLVGYRTGDIEYTEDVLAALKPLA